MILVVQAWWMAFVVTQLVEVPIHARALVRHGSRRWMLAFAASTLTHPVVFFGLPRVVGHGTGGLLVCESFAVLVEAWWLRRLGVSPREALWWSLTANASSVAVASTLRALGLW